MLRTVPLMWSEPSTWFSTDSTVLWIVRLWESSRGAWPEAAMLRFLDGSMYPRHTLDVDLVRGGYLVLYVAYFPGNSDDTLVCALASLLSGGGPGDC